MRTIYILITLFSLPIRADVCAYPIVTESAITDIHESSMNGPLGFAYIVNPKGAKAGRIPAAIDREVFDIDVYASNFQGPTFVPNKRKQFEWSADGQLEISYRRFPLTFYKRCAPTADQLPVVTVKLKEHDEYLTADDKIGAFDVLLNTCVDVLSSQKNASWTQEHRSWGKPYDLGGPSDIAYVVWKIWCYRCDTSTDCQTGISQY